MGRGNSPLIFGTVMRSRKSGQGHRLKRKNIKEAKAEGKTLKKFLKDKKKDK
jgi:hypothetical protein